MQLDRGRGNGVTLLQVSGWAASGQAEELDWVQSPSGATTKPSHEHAKATDFFFSLSFCVAHRVAELESLSVRFTFTAMLCAKVTLSSAPVEEDKVLKLKSFACRSLFHFIPPERRDTADEKRYFFFLLGGGGLQ